MCVAPNTSDFEWTFYEGNGERNVGMFVEKVTERVKKALLDTQCDQKSVSVATYESL